MKIVIIDYGMGNLRSVQKALERTGADAKISSDAKEITLADKLVLPGVGAMAPAMRRLDELNIMPAIKKEITDGKPFLGICLGFQLLFDLSSEGGEVKGLGILPGQVERFSKLKVPHMGWNQLKFTQPDCPLWNGLPANPFVYFCHSYFVKPQSKNVVAAETDYGLSFASACCAGNIMGVQFHPEKSQDIGLTILKNFTQLKL